jgi:hypothetical protein
MPLRRALFLFLSVMLISAMTASLVRRPAVVPPASTDATESETETEPEQAGPRSDTGPRTIELDAGGRERRVRLAPGTHVVLKVESPRPGEIAIPALGQSRSVTPRAPVSFDLLLRRKGRFEVTFSAPARRRGRPVGTLVVAEPASRKSGRPRA